MNKVADIAKDAMQTVNVHSPAILIGVASAGVIATTVLAVRGTVKAMHKIDDENHQREEVDDSDLTGKEIVKLVWPAYIPAIAMGTVTIAAMITSQHISARRSAALMSLYTVTNQAFGDYREKIVETLGEKKELAVRDQIAQEKMDKNPAGDKTIFIASGGDLLCYDEYSGRYFESDMETIRSNQNTLNSQIISQNYASLNDWYRLLGLAPLPTGEEVGWNSDKLMDIRFTAHITPNDRPALSIGFYAEPLAKYYKGFY